MELRKSSKRVAIVQSNYIPWKGYFDLIHSVDEFILFEDVQFTKRDWRNRNQIKTPQGLLWLTIPVATKGKQFQKIKDTLVSEKGWAQDHWRAIQYNYSRAAYFDYGAPILKSLFEKAERLERLSEINALFLQEFCTLLGISTKISFSMDYGPLREGKNERLIDLCKGASADHYVSGPAAKTYLNEHLFQQEGIQVSFMNYAGYPPYPQLYGDFTHTVSMVDLILNQGEQSTAYMKSF